MVKTAWVKCCVVSQERTKTQSKEVAETKTKELQSATSKHNRENRASRSNSANTGNHSSSASRDRPYGCRRPGLLRQQEKPRKNPYPSADYLPHARDCTTGKNPISTQSDWPTKTNLSVVTVFVINVFVVTVFVVVLVINFITVKSLHLADGRGRRKKFVGQPALYARI
jgi:cobalamin biosynthesis Mg chelatase CobN